MKLTIKRQSKCLPKTIKVTLSNVTSTYKIGQLKALAEAMHLDFSVTLGEQYMSCDPHETELFRANFIFPIESNPESAAMFIKSYNHLKEALIMALPYLQEQFLREEKKIQYTRYYDAVMDQLERYRLIGNQSLFYNPINVLSLRFKAAALREKIASLEKEASPEVTPMASS